MKLYVGGIPLIKLPRHGRITLGRFDEHSSDHPDVDLTPCGAFEQGVSRLHAAIAWAHDDLTLTDLNSTNGTFLNGYRLLPFHARVLQPYDEICLGHMVIFVGHEVTRA